MAAVVAVGGHVVDVGTVVLVVEVVLVEVLVVDVVEVEVVEVDGGVDVDVVAAAAHPAPIVTSTVMFWPVAEVTAQFSDVAHVPFAPPTTKESVFADVLVLV